MIPKGSMKPGGDKARALELLASYPHGLNLRQIAVSLSLDPQRAGDVAYRLGKDGLIASVADPAIGSGTGLALKRKRYCLPEHLGTCTEAVRREQRMRQKGAARWPISPMGRVDHPQKEPAESTGVCVPCPPDLRFTVVAPEKFFSDPAYRTSMLRSGSVIEAAYGGGND